MLVESDIRRWCVDEYRRVLVIGAGHDPYRKQFSNAKIYTALDIIALPGVTDLVADATSLPLKDESFDCVAAFEVMEHVEKPVNLIEEAYRVLAPGGVLLLSVPFAFHQHADPSDYWRPTKYTLENATAGFSSAKVYNQGNRLHVISDLLTTAFYPWPVFLPLRIMNHILVWPYLWRAGRNCTGTAPSGFFVVAKK